jgi:hypothetical protein
MQNPVIVTGDVVAQLINIRKVSIDSELKVSLTIEFMATEEKSKENVFKLIQLQGDIAEMTVRPSQQDLFEHAPVAPDPDSGNGRKEQELAYAER